MLSDIQETFDNLEVKYEKLLRQLDPLTDDALTFKAGVDKWSIVEVIEHLVLAEENMQEQLSGATAASALDP